MKTELVFLLDKSGSMSGLEKDTIGGFNSMLQKQGTEEGDVSVTTILFSDAHELLHDRFPIATIRPLNSSDYQVGGMTALYDAIGEGIKKISNVVRHTDEQTKVIFIISTDGEENASQHFTQRKIKTLIEEKQKEGWEFLFLGANIDAILAAGSIGIPQESAVEYLADSLGTEKNFSVMSEAISYMRKGKKLNADWKSDIENDVKSRKR